MTGMTLARRIVRGRLVAAWLLAPLALLVLGSPATAADLTGTVVDPGGTGVFGVNIDVVDAATGDSIPLTNDGTDPSGVFLVTVPDNATYHVHFKAPTSTRLVSRIVRDVVVTVGTTDMGVIPLEQGALLTGQVVRLSDGTPVADVDIDVDRSSTGERIYTPGDNTDANGIFEVIVPVEPVDLSVSPDKAERLVGLVLAGIAIAGDTNVGALALEPGALLFGTAVRASNGTPVVGADTDLVDPATGATIPTSGDDTDAAGFFSVVAPFRSVDFVIEPVKADRLVAREILGIDVAGDTDLGTVALDAGALLSGKVVRSSNGTPVVDADTDAQDAFTGASIPLPGDNTDANGDFSVVVPYGTILFTIEPRKADRLVAYRAVDLDIVADTNLGTIALDGGFLVSGTVQGPGGPASGVSVAAYDSVSGVRIHTPDSQSGADGSYSFVLPAGTFVVKWSPPLGQGTARTIVDPFPVAADVVYHPTLSASAASVTVGGTGHLVIAGQKFKPTVSVYNNSGAPLPIRAVLEAEAPSRGITKSIGPPKDKTLPAVAHAISRILSVRAPADLNPPLRGIPIYVRVRILDPSSQALIDEDFVEFQVR